MKKDEVLSYLSLIMQRIQLGREQNSYIHVTNSDSDRVDKNDYKVNSNSPRESSISLDDSKLKSGVYTVSWLVLSKDGGHI